MALELIQTKENVLQLFEKKYPNSQILQLIQSIVKNIPQNHWVYRSYISELENKIINMPDEDLLKFGHFILKFSLCLNNIAAIQQFIKKINRPVTLDMFIIQQDSLGWTPLHAAVRFNSLDGFRALINNVRDETLLQATKLKTIAGNTIDSFLNDSLVCEDKTSFVLELYIRYAASKEIWDRVTNRQKEKLLTYLSQYTADMIREIAFTAYKKYGDKEFIKAYLQQHIKHGTLTKKDIDQLSNQELTVSIGSNGENILGYACWKGNQQVIELLTNAIKGRSRRRGSAFHRQQDYFSSLFLQQNNNDDSALTFAIQYQKAQTLEVLLEAVSDNLLIKLLGSETNIFTSLENRKDVDKNRMRLVLLERLTYNDELAKFVPKSTMEIFLNDYEKLYKNPNKAERDQAKRVLDSTLYELKKRCGISNDTWALAAMLEYKFLLLQEKTHDPHQEASAGFLSALRQEDDDVTRDTPNAPLNGM